MAVVSKITGIKELSAALKALGPEVTAKVRMLNLKTGLAVQMDAIKSIQRGPKTGRQYTRRSVTHQASAPGEAPATDTGRLAGSVKRVDDGIEVAVGTSVEYGAFLEFGTSKIKPRPWLFPALEANRQKWERGVMDIINSLKRPKKEK